MKTTRLLPLCLALLAPACVDFAAVDRGALTAPDAAADAPADRADVLAVDAPGADVVVIDTGDAVVVWLSDREDAGQADAPADAGTPSDAPDVSDAGTPAADAPDALPVDAGASDAGTPAEDAAPACGGLELRCHDGCRAVLSDPMNCGACGRQCPSSATGAGYCAGGRCEVDCAAGWATCGAAACGTNVASDHANCGACGRACGGAEVCRAGACVGCGAGEAACDNACVRLDTAEHCGSCSHRCSLGARCAGGTTCEYTSCAAGRDAGIWTVCPDGCVDVGRDDRNCLGCGNVCAAGTHCRGGCN